MNRTTARLGIGLLLAAQVLLFQNCSATKFTDETAIALAEAAGSPTDSIVPHGVCDQTFTDTTRDVKILFLVDASGSNLKEQNGSSGTDPIKRWRAAAINGVVNRYGSRPNFSFGMATFQGTSTRPQIRGSANEAIFTTDAAAVQTGITNFMNNADVGNTPYKSSLSLAKSLILRDIAANPGQNAAYSVIMVSDGMATDYRSPSEIIPDAKALVAIAPTQVRLNSVFYYNDPAQKTEANMQYLKNLAIYGNGSFAISNSSETILLEDIIKVQMANCQN